MKRYIKSDSLIPLYRTKKSGLINEIDTDKKGYYPGSRVKDIKMLPGKEKSRAVKNMVFDTFDVFDSYEDGIEEVYAELKTYSKSEVANVAESIADKLDNFTRPNHYVASDELAVLDALINAAGNLEILEKATEQFESKTGLTIRWDSLWSNWVTYPSGHKESALHEEQTWKALSGEYSPDEVVDFMMMPRYKKNIKQYGQRR